MKIIATDYDGTLNYKGIDVEKREAIALWRKKGNLFGIVSGRSEQSLKERLLEDKIEVDFLIANNGATICNGEGKLLKGTVCNGQGVNDLLRFLFNEGCLHSRIHTKNGHFIIKREEDLSDGEFTISSLPLIEDFYQVSALFETSDQSRNSVKNIAEKFATLYNPLGNRRWIDVVPIGVCKSKGIHSLKEIYGIKESDIITVGDSENDIDMLKNFKSFAMENALNEVKAAAKGSVKSVTEIIFKEM